MALLKNLPISDRPREKLGVKGPAGLSDAELLAIILGTGTKGRDVLTVASDCLGIIDGSPQTLELEKLTNIAGVGLAKASLLVAALEFVRRRIRPLGTKVRSALDAYPLLRHYADRRQEHFICISLNGAHEVIAIRVVTIGLVNATQVHPREVFSDPICDRACAVLVAHNHPSGNLTPSDEDKKVTRSLRDSGSLLGIKLLDHIIFSQTEFFSFADQGLM
jgi:DNA repair protein RadC